MSKVQEFLDKVRTDPKAVQMAADIGKPKNQEEFIQNYMKLSESLGFSLTRDDLLAGFGEMAAEKKAQAAKAASEISKTAVSEDDLSSVAGGEMGDHGGICSTSYKTGEHCWFNDSCSVIINYYTDTGTLTENPFCIAMDILEPEKNDVWDFDFLGKKDGTDSSAQ